MKILLTGATGFLGYNIALNCLKDGHELLCLKRPLSRNPFVEKNQSNLRWVNSGDSGWKVKIERFMPQILIHCAWSGVSSSDRNNLDIQKNNVIMTEQLMKAYPYKQIIMLGSQDEYGVINSVVSEDYFLNPISEYAKTKIECYRILKQYAESHHIVWQWLRVFSVYGLRQGNNWIIPSTILKCLHGDASMDTTKGEQAYAYLYASDFANAILSMIGSKNESGIYNLSSANAIRLKDLFLMIKDLTKSDIHFNFGAIDYRQNQSMLIQGDVTKFVRTFGVFEKISMIEGLNEVIRSYK